MIFCILVIFFKGKKSLGPDLKQTIFNVELILSILIRNTLFALSEIEVKLGME